LFLQLERSLNISIRRWLDEGEKDKSGKLPPVDADSSNMWEDMFSNIHKSFNIPRASKIAINEEITRMKNQHLQRFSNHMLFTPTQHVIFMTNDLMEDLTILQACFIDTDCCGFALMFSTLLCDVANIVKLLRSHPECKHNYISMLSHTNNAEYRALREQVTEQMQNE